MARYQCTLCGWIYDDADQKVPFDSLPDDWVCPVCGSPKSAFKRIAEGPENVPAASGGPRAPRRYQCPTCGWIYDEAFEGVPFDSLPDDWVCIMCGERKENFILLEDCPPSGQSGQPGPEHHGGGRDSEFDPSLIKHDGGVLDEIHEMAATGKSPGQAMDTLLPVPKFDDILILGGQLAHPPLDDGAPVNISTVIGTSAARPMVLDNPIFISHMSFGALSATAKTALAMGASAAGSAMCSGEGGALPAEMEASDHYIFEYVPNKYSVSDATFGRCSAVEIKIGQGTKPGMGGHLPGAKVTPAIAEMRGKPPGQDIQSPSRFPEINSPEDLRDMVSTLRERTGGKPIGVKIAAERIEDDLEFISHSGCDFITIDGRGGATGSSPKFLRDASSVPTVYALARARRYMDAHGMTQELVITGGLRTGGDCAKAIAMGADAVALASGPLIALGCQRYRACGSGRCPIGIATQDPELESRLDLSKGAVRVENYLKALSEELRVFARVTGYDDIHDLGLDDLCTTDSDIAAATGIRHA